MRIRTKAGLDLPVAGAPAQSVHAGPAVRHVALIGRDYPGLRARVEVSQGDKIHAGQTLFSDKQDPAVKFVAPGTGTIAAINHGPRRALESVVIQLQKASGADQQFERLSNQQLQALPRDTVVGRLLESGLWPALRTRPFSRVPKSDSAPCSIFVTAIDTQPLAPDPRVVIEPRREDFIAGLQVLRQLTDGTVWLCTAPDWGLGDAGIDGLRRVSFAGPHPAGLAGTHIHFLDPVGLQRTVWHINYQDVIAFGKLFARGLTDTERTVAIAGEPVVQPRLVRTRLGASVGELMDGALERPETCRIISGSVLNGTAAGDGYLGRYHNQVSVVREGGERKLFGWLGLSGYTAGGSYFRRTGHRKTRVFDTTRYGRNCAMLPVRVFERLVPLDILPSVLFRALLVGDTERAIALGCLELDEEDLALCSFVCPAKSDFGAALRLNLDQIASEL